MISRGDGGADLDGLDDNSLMINHTSQVQTSQLIVDIATAGGSAILPVGGPTCVGDNAMIPELPTEL